MMSINQEKEREVPNTSGTVFHKLTHHYMLISLRRQQHKLRNGQVSTEDDPSDIPDHRKYTSLER